MRIIDFDVYKDLLKERSGLVITPDKSYLLESRLGPVAKKWNYPSIDAMTIDLQGVPDLALVNDVVEAMTTNETSFFRDNRPFDTFKEYALPEIISKRATRREVKIWCAAASSGQEPYSLAMLLKEMESSIMAGWRSKIKATDISHEILNQAKEGLYSQFEVQRGLPIQLLMKYFTQESDNKWQINDALRRMVDYSYFNLLDNMSLLGKFDIIFCRNVLIYFDEQTKRDILGRMKEQLEPDGFLFLGGAETVLGITDAFKALPDKRGVYVPVGSPHLQAAPASGSQAIA